MKKLLLYFTILLLFPLNSFAKNGAYIGINGNRSFADHKIVETANTNVRGIFFIQQDRTTTNADNVGFGFEGGYRFDLKDGFFITSELFFDQLNNNAMDPYASGNPNDQGFASRQDRIILNYRYGAKLNLGYEFNKKFGAFVNGGIGVVDYDVPWNSQAVIRPRFNSYGSTSDSAVYGIGAHYNLSEKLAIKASYDVQKLAIRYNLDGWRSSVELRVFKLGLNYNF